MAGSDVVDADWINPDFFSLFFPCILMICAYIFQCKGEGERESPQREEPKKRNELLQTEPEAKGKRTDLFPSISFQSSNTLTKEVNSDHD